MREPDPRPPEAAISTFSPVATSFMVRVMALLVEAALEERIAWRLAANTPRT